MSTFNQQYQQLRQQINVAGNAETIKQIQIGDITNNRTVAVGENINIYMTQKADYARLENARVRLAQMPTETIPIPAQIPVGSRIIYPPNPHFVGRERALLTLAHQLKGGEIVSNPPCVIVTGIGGIGKTQLAATFADLYGHYFLGGVYWVNMAEASSVRDEIIACGQEMVELSNSQGTMVDPNFAQSPLVDPVQRILTLWRSELPRLLIFDNCEDPALLDNWRPLIGGSRVLVTSRRQKWDRTRGSHVLALDILTRTQSIELLLKFCPHLCIDKTETGLISESEENNPKVSRDMEDVLSAIAEELGDLPLALQLAGRYIEIYHKDIKPIDYLHDLQNSDILDHESLNATGYNPGEVYSPTLHDLHVGRTFDLSFQRLEPSDTIDLLARMFLVRAAYFAPNEPIPRSLLIKTVDATESVLFKSRALHRLTALGLLVERDDIFIVHRLVIYFVQMLTLDEKAQDDVRETIYQEAATINRSSIPETHLLLQPHLRYIIDNKNKRNKEHVDNPSNDQGMLGDGLFGIACLALGWLYTLQGNFFDALRITIIIRKDSKDEELSELIASALLQEAYIYRRLMMPRYARNAAVKAASIFKQKQIINECVEAYLIATDIALIRSEVKRAYRYLREIQPLLDYAPYHLKLLWRSYNAHPILQKTIQQCQSALKTLDQVAVSLAELGATRHALDVCLMSCKVLAILNDQNTIKRYQTLIEDAHKHGLVYLEQDACVGLAQHQDLEEAHKTLRRAVAILVQIRQTMPVGELKANLWTGQIGLYIKLIETQLRSQQSLDAANTLLEAKAGIWVDFSTTSMEHSTDEKWISARRELVQYQEELQEACLLNNSEYLKSYRRKVSYARAEFIAATRTHDRYNQASKEVKKLLLPTVEDIQSQLKIYQTQASKSLSKLSLVLDYFVSSSHIYVCIIPSEGTVEWIRLGMVKDVEWSIAKLDMIFFTILQGKQHPTQVLKELSDQVLSSLYNHLVEPLKKHFDQHPQSISELIISPHDLLFSVPWSALYDTEQYLGERYHITLLPSFISFARQSSKHHDEGIYENPQHTDIESINNSNSPEIVRVLGYEGNPPLPNLQQELSYIHEILPNAERIHPAKTTDLTWEKPPKCLHIATHGAVDFKNPLLSNLEMLDGPLFLADIFNFNLMGTDLVTLSACDTGVIPEQGGVVMALAGSFLSIGAKTVISCLWAVEDHAAKLFMTSFYQEWQRGNSVAASLQTAQAFVRSQGYGHPFYWAAFQSLSR
ncbi:MAG: CHAT domain-containing protein [Chloroflexota bacterium]